MRVTRFGPMGASVVVLDDEGRTGDLHVVEKKMCGKVGQQYTHMHTYTQYVHICIHYQFVLFICDALLFSCSNSGSICIIYY